ncbi:MAG: imidazolonepropionase-like amidohydrolase, partial [Nitriliruptoraceae bacterium]
MTRTQRIQARQLIPGRGAPITDGVVVLDGETITYAGPATGAPDTPHADVTVCDTVMPGMWDAHVHLMGVADLRLDRVATHRSEPAMLRVASDAGKALRMGFTSLREVGGRGVHVELVRREGLVRAPRVYSSNAILSTTAGHGDLHDLPLEMVERFGAEGGLLQIADGVPEVLKAVRRQLRLDAKLIKICASGGVLSEVDHPLHQQFSGEELRAIVEEAARAERIVAAHCHGEAGIEA